MIATKIKISWADLMGSFINHFIPLAGLKSNEGTGRLKYAVKQTLPNVQKAVKDYNEKLREHYEKGCKFDDNGNPVIDEQNRYGYESTQKRKETLKNIKDWEKTKVEIEITCVKMSDFEGVPNFNTATELALDKFITDVNDQYKEFEEKASKNGTAKKSEVEA